jgi:5'-nucleotidase
MDISHARRGARILALALAALAIAVPAAQAAKHSKAPKHPKDVSVQLLGINDFHGNLEPPTGSGGRIQEVAGGPQIDAGGAVYLANQLRTLRQQHRNTLTVSAGDLIGASPLLSALFHDEPTIEAMNEMGLDLNAVGNHEFDEGVMELLRMQRGGCGPDNSCPRGNFEGADFRFLAANVVWKDTGEPIFPPYAIRKFGHIKVGFIGMTLEGTPNIVSASGIQDVEFLDEAETANRYARELRRERGVRAIVVLLHEGGVPTPFAGIDFCNVSGPITDIVDGTTQAVDLFITGHTHQPYICTAGNDSLIDGRPVTSASSFGRLVTNIGFTLDRRTKDIESVTADNTIVRRTQPAAPDIQQLIDRYNTLADPIATRPVGRISSDIPRTSAPSGENPLGNLIADAQLADTDDADRGDADIALMNPGGVRADLTFASSPKGEGDGVVTYGEAFTVQPFNNIVTTNTFTGAQLLDVLKDQWCGPVVEAQVVLLPSSTLTYTYSRAVATAISDTPCAGAPNPVSNVRVNGVPLDTAATYRVTTNNFLADGGDGFQSLRAGTNRTSLPDFDVDSLVRYLEPTLTGAPIGPPATNRITVVP